MSLGSAAFRMIALNIEVRLKLMEMDTAHMMLSLHNFVKAVTFWCIIYHIELSDFNARSILCVS